VTPVEEVLEAIREIATDEHDKGDRFERLKAHAFRTDRTYRQQFTDVWRWMDWPGRSGADIGVDLVARDAEGQLTAIQCKCYAPTTTLTKEEIDSFVALSGQRQWARRIVVATTDLWSTNAEKSLEGHAVPVERMGVDDLDAMTVDWSSYDVANPSGLLATDRSRRSSGLQLDQDDSTEPLEAGRRFAVADNHLRTSRWKGGAKPDGIERVGVRIINRSARHVGQNGQIVSSDARWLGPERWSLPGVARCQSCTASEGTAPAGRRPPNRRWRPPRRWRLRRLRGRGWRGGHCASGGGRLRPCLRPGRRALRQAGWPAGR